LYLSLPPSANKFEKNALSAPVEQSLIRQWEYEYWRKTFTSNRLRQGATKQQDILAARAAAATVTPAWAH